MAARDLAWAAVVALWSSGARAADPGDAHSVSECIASSENGQTERDSGQYRRARQDFVRCARDECPAVVAKSCASWLRQLDDTAPTIVLGARDEQGHDLDDVSVTFDGEPFASKLDGRPVEVDGGAHVLKFERPGSTPVEERVVLRAGEKARVVAVTLRSAIPAPPPASVVAEAPPPEPEALLSAHHVTAGALALGALGALGVGAFFVVQADSESRTASQLRGSLPTNACVGVSSPLCSNLTQTVNQQHTDVNVATSLFVVSGVLAAGAVAAWYLWPRDDVPHQSGGLAPVPGGALVFFETGLP